MPKEPCTTVPSKWQEAVFGVEPVDVLRRARPRWRPAAAGPRPGARRDARTAPPGSSTGHTDTADRTADRLPATTAPGPRDRDPALVGEHRNLMDQVRMVRPAGRDQTIRVPAVFGVEPVDDLVEPGPDLAAQVSRARFRFPRPRQLVNVAEGQDLVEGAVRRHAAIPGTPTRPTALAAGTGGPSAAWSPVVLPSVAGQAAYPRFIQRDRRQIRRIETLGGAPGELLAEPLLIGKESGRCGRRCCGGGWR